MANNRRDDDLAYGEYHGQQGEEGDRGLVGDMGRRLFGRKEVRLVVSPQPPGCHSAHRPELLVSSSSQCN